MFGDEIGVEVDELVVDVRVVFTIRACAEVEKSTTARLLIGFAVTSTDDVGEVGSSLDDVGSSSEDMVDVERGVGTGLLLVAASASCDSSTGDGLIVGRAIEMSSVGGDSLIGAAGSMGPELSPRRVTDCL